MMSYDKFIFIKLLNITKMNNLVYLGLANQTADFNGSLCRTERESSEEMVLFLYLKNTHTEKNSTVNLSKLKGLLSEHRLSESDEYQMVVTLAMDLDDEKAEKIICGYIRRYGLSSWHARQALKDLGFQKALKILYAQDLETKSDEPLDLCEEPFSIHQRLEDGFEMMRDDEILSI
jgi:hypothetical protein